MIYSWWIWYILSITYDDDGNIIISGSCATTNDVRIQSPSCPIRKRFPRDVRIDLLDGCDNEYKTIDKQYHI